MALVWCTADGRDGRKGPQRWHAPCGDHNHPSPPIPPACSCCTQTSHHTAHLLRIGHLGQRIHGAQARAQHVLVAVNLLLHCTQGRVVGAGAGREAAEGHGFAAVRTATPLLCSSRLGRRSRGLPTDTLVPPLTRVRLDLGLQRGLQRLHQAVQRGGHLRRLIGHRSEQLRTGHRHQQHLVEERRLHAAAICIAVACRPERAP